MNNRICDLHCDTLYNLRKIDGSLAKNQGHLSLEKLSEFESFLQVLAVWSEHKHTNNEAFDAFLESAKRLSTEIKSAQKEGYRVALAKSGSDITENEKNGISSLVLAVEDGKLLDTDLEKLDTLHSLGVRLLTLVWADTCPIGGAHNNNEGLTEFGREVVKKCFETGIIPDVSHANTRQIDEVLEIAQTYNKPVVATHSNSKSVHIHTRNLTDGHYREIVRLGGVVGVSMACEHLSEENADINDYVKHIMHYFNLSPDGVCLGGDFDGVERLPIGIKDVRSYKDVAIRLVKAGLDNSDVEKIMYKNARDFLVKNL